MSGLIPYFRRPAPSGRAGKALAIEDLRDYVYKELQNIEQSVGRYAVRPGEVGVKDLTFPFGDVRRYGAVGDGIANDTAALQHASDSAAGHAVYVPRGYTFMASASWRLASATHYYGGGRIKATSAASLGYGPDGLGKGLLYGVDCVGTFVDDIEVDANADAGALCHGIVFNGGEWNTVKDSHVHDTDQAGIEGINTNNFKVEDNDVRDCGRTATNDHGVMFVSTLAGGMLDTVCKLNRVNGSHRKGITTYAQTPGFFKGLDISVNTITGSGLGNIFIGVVSGAGIDTLTLIGNTCRNSPVNMSISEVTNGTVAVNTCSDTTNDANILLLNCTDVTVSANTCTRAFFHNIALRGAANLRVKVIGNTLSKANVGAFGTGSGISLFNASYCDVTGNTVSDDDGNQVWCVLEDAGCDHNTIEDNPHLEDFVTARVNVTGANTRCSASTGLNRGVGTFTPTDALDIAKTTRFQGTVRHDPLFVVLATGDNDDVPIPAAGKVFVPYDGVGPMGASFAVTGLDSSGSDDGREIEMYNASTNAMTIRHQSAGSSVGNRIAIGGSADLVISPNGAVTLRLFKAAYGPATWAVKSYTA